MYAKKKIGLVPHGSVGESISSRVMKALATLLPVLFYFMSMPLVAQTCEADGVEVTFLRDKGNGIDVRDVKPKDLIGRNDRDTQFGLGPAIIKDIEVNSGLINVALVESDELSNEMLMFGSFSRKKPNVWEVNFPRGLYEFRNKNQLEIEVILTVMGGQASHVTEGQSSTLSLNVELGKVHEQWWGGTNSLKSLRGGLELYYSDFQNLSNAGDHRAELTICVNIKGNM